MTDNKKKPLIACAEGDGIGPEIMAPTLEILEKANANIEIQKVLIGEKAYHQGFTHGITPEAWDIIRKSQAFLKAPITTPQGGGFKSLNVTIRTSLGLFANIRPCISYHPYISTKHPVMDVVIIRENEEDLYTGIEYRQTQDCYQALKMITYPGCEKIIRYAFEYAVANNRKKVTCFTKDNILKLSDGLFHKTFIQIAKEYPMIENEHWIIDIGAAKLANSPEVFDVIVMPNLYGDILSDVAAQIAGSVGLAGSANIGIHGAMFEAIHGSAPRRAGQNLANPSGLILASIQMLAHIGQSDIANKIYNAWLKTIEDGIHTYDIFREGHSKEKVGTKEFGQAVIERLGLTPKKLKPIQFNTTPIKPYIPSKKTIKKELVGVDIFIDSKESINSLVNKLLSIPLEKLSLKSIFNRGVKVWPDGLEETFCVDQWRCRFLSNDKKAIDHQAVIKLLQKLNEKNIDFTQTEHLYLFDGEPLFCQSDLF